MKSARQRLPAVAVLLALVALMLGLAPVPARSASTTVLITAVFHDPYPDGDPGDLFVKPGGSGTTCSQSSPCALQTALGQATDGDTLYLAGGTYTGSGSNVIAIGKSITLYGGWDGAATGPVVRDPIAYPTTLDGKDARRVVYISPNTAPTIDGLRLTNGSASDGGAIYANGAQPIVSDCRIFHNTAGNSGGAVYFNNSPNARLIGNMIYSNAANTYYGGGVYLRNGTNAVVQNNTIHNNLAGGEGGGIYVTTSDNVTLQSNTIYSNTTGTYGGGVFFGGSADATMASNQVFGNAANQGGGILLNNSPDATLRGNTVYGNTADNWGGGVSLYVRSDGASLTENTVYDNAAGSSGGGLFLYESADLTLINNMVVQNRLNGVGGGGAGIYAYDAAARLLHTTIARNSGGDGQGIHLQYRATVWMTNTILVSHTVGIEAGTATTATLAVTLWGIGEWANEDDTAGSGSISTGTNNIWDDPAFVNPADGDYHISVGSAAIDAGVDAGVTTDIDGDPRPFGAAPDIGADEIVAKVYLPLVLRNYP